ncbi:hypothetical protein [Microvirga sp. P5_D2]
MCSDGIGKAPVSPVKMSLGPWRSRPLVSLRRALGGSGGD